ncbi:MAG: hypothetical protein D6706_22250 [Chloroflexi bacterium]|nr:MAG: hypothetical protein D6706_22250 [Chloroflexota bacterium]
MSTNWLYRIHVIIPAGDQAALNSYWTLIAPAGDPEARTFGVPLSSTGAGTATHRGASTAATPAMRGMIEAMAGDELAGVVFYICDAFTGELLAQQNGTLTLGQAIDWQDVLEDQGLQTIIPPEVI